jgi:hypothetical protein
MAGEYITHGKDEKFVQNFSLKHEGKESLCRLVDGMMIFKRVLFLLRLGSDYISELRPTAGLLFIPHVIYGYGATVELY